MTHAAIHYTNATTMSVEFAYDEQQKDAIKALPGTSFDGGQWIVPIMHLPRMKPLFDCLTVALAVVAAYHSLLRRMVTDFATSQHRKGALGQHIAELMALHANGIVAAKATETPQTGQGKRKTAPTTIMGAKIKSSPVSASQPANSDDRQLALWLRGVKNAMATEEKKSYTRRRNTTKRRAFAEQC